MALDRRHVEDTEALMVLENGEIRMSKGLSLDEGRLNLAHLRSVVPQKDSDAERQGSLTTCQEDQLLRTCFAERH